jgi:PAS domain S-box-containing protein
MPEPTQHLLASGKTLKQHSVESEVLFTSMGDGAITTDEFGRITRVNPAAESMLGYSEADLKGVWFPSSIIALNLDGSRMNVLERPLTQAFMTGRAVNRKIFYITGSGQQLPVSINVSPILIKGKPVGAIELFRDISSELEIDRMKSEFISLASHQLRTPLSAIQTYAHMLSDGYLGELNSVQKASLDTIVKATNRMNELISTLLNITRMESGSIEVHSRPMKVDTVIEQIMHELRVMADAKAISLTLKTVGQDSTEIYSDQLIVKEIVTNLTSNAIKYTPENGKVSITVRPQKNGVQVRIRDSGWGIPGRMQYKVFTKFFRSPNIAKRETTGTGLGLYLVKGLLDTLGGRIWFESGEGEGTTFYFTLPKKIPKPAPRTSKKLNRGH